MKTFNVPVLSNSKNVLLVNYWNGYIEGYLVATLPVRAKTLDGAIATLYKGKGLPPLERCLVADCR
jgi:hypothetical protein